MMMGLFDRLFKKEEIEYQHGDIVALANADIVPVSQVKDVMFAEEMMGQTLAFELRDHIVAAPCSGTLEVMYPTGHAFAIRCENGLGILVHIGIDTVNLKGRGFKVFGKQGQKVKANQKLVEVDTQLIREEGYDPTCMMIITEPIHEERIKFTCGASVKRGQVINQ